MKFNIGQIEVGHGCRPLVIPEIGINHNGKKWCMRRTKVVLVL